MEPFIARVLDMYPTACKFDPARVNLSCETFARKFREAIQAKIIYKFGSNLIPQPAFDNHADSISAVMDKEGYVWAGTLQSIKAARMLVETESAETVNPMAEYSVDIKGVILYCKLIEYITPKPTNFFLIHADEPRAEELISQLEATYDVGFLKTQPGKWQIV
jgi:hypothetical protein